MIKYIAIFLIMLIPNVTFAQDPVLPQITPLQKNERAPYSGVLYNPAAVADAIAQREHLIEQHQLNLNILEQHLKAECDLRVGNISAELDGCNDRYFSVIAAKDEQIKKLEDLAISSSDNSKWWFVGGIVLGIVTTVGVTHLVGSN